MTRDAIIFSGGVGHPFEETSPLLAELIKEAGWEPRIETDIDRAVSQLPNCNLFAVNALYWSMGQHEKYAALRREWARSLPDDQMESIESFVHDGGRLFVLHTGTICWDTQPRWRELMGGGWDWDRSHHPPLGPVSINLTDDGARMVAASRRFDLIDEAYHELAPTIDCNVLATADLGRGPQPLAWTREFGRGKVAVDALGHDRRSLEQPDHRALIRAQLDWLRG